jgi:hypothetical protein
MQERIFKRFTESNKLIMTARLRLLGIGKFAFETSLFGEKPYETNINMPLFDTEEQAYEWILGRGKGWHE